MADYKNAARPEAINQATAFIDKSLRRQRPLITEKDLIQATNDCNARLVNLAETIFQAIIANIADDEGISKALDKLLPSVLHASV
jgi:hypothetical protein